MLVQSADIWKLINKIADHYRNNVANKFIRPEFRVLKLESRVLDNLDDFASRGASGLRSQGLHLDDLYHLILSLGRFVKTCRVDLLPQVRRSISLGHGRRSPQEKLLADMAANNFPSNLNVLADLVNDLFVAAQAEDQRLSAGKKPASAAIPELKDFGSLLVP